MGDANLMATPAEVYKFNLGAPPPYVAYVESLQLGAGDPLKADYPVTDPETGKPGKKVCGILSFTNWDKQIGSAVTFGGLLSEDNAGTLADAESALEETAVVTFQLNWLRYNMDGAVFFPYFFQKAEFKGEVAKTSDGKFDIHVDDKMTLETGMPSFNFHMAVVGSTEEPDQDFQTASKPNANKAAPYSAKKGA